MKALTFLKNICFVTLPTLFVLIAFFELFFFRVIIPAAELPVLRFDTTDHILKFNPLKQRQGYYSMGKLAQEKYRWEINNEGWNSEIDYFSIKRNSKKRICIIGDSYIEAMQTDTDKNIAAYLRRLLPDGYEVYSFGTSGSPLSQYLHLSRYVNDKFDPDILIFLLVHNDFDESLAEVKRTPDFLQLIIDGDSVTEIAPVPQKMRQYLKISSIVRYFYANYRIGNFYNNIINQNNTSKFNANIQAQDVLNKQSLIVRATDYVFGRIKSENPDRKVILLMDAPRQDIYRGSLDSSTVLWLNRMVSDVANQYNIPFLDLTTSFQRDFDKNKVKFNSNIDGHWNTYGHRIAANELYKSLGLPKDN